MRSTIQMILIGLVILVATVSTTPSAEDTGLIATVASQGKAIEALKHELDRRGQVQTFELNRNPGQINLHLMENQVWLSEQTGPISVKKGDQLLVRVEFGLNDGNFGWHVIPDDWVINDPKNWYPGTSNKVDILSSGARLVTATAIPNQSRWTSQSTTALFVAKDNFDGENGVRFHLRAAHYPNVSGLANLSSITVIVQNLGSATLCHAKP
ncbi:MAG: hypothetical protein JWM11_782 [Planctomycetaceae bacterium]|nr:hypothetical protein [Planctomycetaceae bacterium]